MSKKPLILGIETSCDETAASIISENAQGDPIILSNIVSSQVDVHKRFGGVVPELAARSHIEKIDWIVKKAIDESGREINEIDAKLKSSNISAEKKAEISKLRNIVVSNEHSNSELAFESYEKAISLLN